MKNVVLAIVGVFILGACSTSNEVVGGGIFQKRKHTGGVYWDRTEKLKASKEANEEEFDIFKLEEESQKKYVSSTTIYNEDQVITASSSEDLIVSEESSVVSTTEEKSSASTVSDVKSETSNERTVESSKDKKNKINVNKSNSSAPASDVNLILLVILALLIPPLAVFLYEGVTSRFWIDLILAIIGWGVGIWLLGGLGWVCGLAAVIYALLIVLEVI